MPVIISKNAAGQSEIEADIPRIVAGYREKSDMARQTRGDLNKQGWDLYHGRQDWSHKQKYQSKEFLPDLPIAIEQFAGVIERALTDFGDWFEIEPVMGGYDDMVQQLLLDPITLAKLLAHCLARLWMPGNQADTAYGFPTMIADATKLGIIEAIVTLKVYGVDAEEPRFRLERAVTEEVRDLGNGYELVYPVLTQVVGRAVARTFRLAIEPVPWEDFFPDPSGLNIYDIHEVTRGIHELRENPDYDPEALDLLEAQRLQSAEAEQEKRRRSGQDDAGLDDLLKVRVRECWGDIVDPRTGRILERNVLVTTVDDTTLLRPPTPNPFWHGKRPFVKSPLIRVPLSVVHKALLDHAGPMAKLMNEVMNLMIDGGMSATWGVRQIRPDMMESPEEVSDGVPQGYTAVLKPNAPHDAKFLERVDSGEMPEYTVNVFNRIERSFQMGMMVPDLKMGQLPPRQVKACVPMYSEALTREGWRKYHELSIGQEILALDPATGELKWTPILALYKHEAAETVQYKNSQWEVVCTPNHKWVAQQYDYHKRELKPERTLKPIAEYNNGAVIQTTPTLPAPDGSGVTFTELPDLLQRENLPELVLQMTSAQRAAFIMGMMAGEGFKRDEEVEHPQMVFTQKDGPVFDAFRLACFLEGIRTSATTNTYTDGRNGQTYTKRHAMLFYHSGVWVQSLKRSDAGVQPVWCPQTQYKTWVMRQGDTITITGNTEVVESMAAVGSLFETIVARLEDSLIAPTLELAWQVIWQHLGDFTAPELVQVLGPRRAILLARMTPAERFVRMAQAVKFKVKGLRAVMGQAREYMKHVSFLQLLFQNPALAAAFDREYSVVKLLKQVMKSVQIDPAALEKDEGVGPELNPVLLAGGQGSPAALPEGGEIEQAMAPANPTGERGVQTP